MPSGNVASQHEGTALAVWAGPRAAAKIRRDGLKPSDIALVPAAAGGPKGLILNPMDRMLFGRWLAGSDRTLHLVGASIGAWRMACACAADADRALAALAEGYIGQAYPPGRKRPTPRTMSALFDDALQALFGATGWGREALAHPGRRLHVVASRGRGPLLRGGGKAAAVGYAGAFAANALRRRWLGQALERVMFSDPRDALPVPLDDLRHATVPLAADNLMPALLATASIPFWLEPVRDIPHAPRGAYWDGGITDYHLHLQYARMPEGLVLYPHFQPELVPGWLDKGLRHRHAASPWLDNVVVLHPRRAWIDTLPRAKLPDRNDFMKHLDDHASRQADWRRAVSQAQQLADEAEAWLADPKLVPVANKASPR